MNVSEQSFSKPMAGANGLFHSTLRNGYALAVITVIIAWTGTLLLHRIVPDRPLSFVLFFAAVAVSAGLRGLWAGVLATLLSALLCDYFFLAPLHSFAVAASDLPLLVLFIVAALLINGLGGRLRAQALQADQRYYGLVQGLDGIVWEANPRTMQFTFVSQRAELLLGYPIPQWLADPEFRSRITHPDDTLRMKALWRQAVGMGGEHTADYRVLTTEGREVWIRETVTVLHDPSGRPIRVSGLGIDITERKAEAEELIRMKDEFAALNKINAALSASLELPDFVDILKGQLQQYLGITAGRFFVADEAGEDLHLVDTWGVTPDSTLDGNLAPPESRDLHCPSAGTVPTFDDTSGFTVSLVSPPMGREDLESTQVLTIPLLAKDALRGALTLYRPNSFRLEGSRDAFYAALGRQIGALLHNVTLYREVHAARERLQQLSRQLVNVQEAERRAIARELHDEIGQVLTGLKLTLEMSGRMPEESLAEHMQKALALVQDLIKQVEGLSLDLRPAVLDDLGLLPALHWHCKRYTALTGINVNLEHSGADARFPGEVEITAYRIIQEALTNVARYAAVGDVTVRLWATREILGIQVADQGQGFDLDSVSAERATGGLTGMRERATLLNGHLTVETSPAMGTSVTVDLPLAAPSKYPDGAADTLPPTVQNG